MDLLVSKGIAAYAVDLRGMGATSRDTSGWTTPAQSVEDVRDVVDFLAERGILRPVLIGWSQGALIAQIFAQKYASKISSLVLYGSIYNPDLMNPSPDPLVHHSN
jgi:pimeloyl-ACP methyl ester carboxylesterase